MSARSGFSRVALGALSILSGAAALLTASCGNVTLTKQDCERYRDHLVEWGKAKGSVDQQKVDDFMSACPGAVVSRSAHGCLEKAGDEGSFFKCLE